MARTPPVGVARPGHRAAAGRRAWCRGTLSALYLLAALTGLVLGGGGTAAVLSPVLLAVFALRVTVLGRLRGTARAAWSAGPPGPPARGSRRHA